MMKPEHHRDSLATPAPAIDVDDRPKEFSASATVLALLQAILDSVKPRLAFSYVTAANNAIGAKGRDGILRSIHNPGSADVTLTIVEGRSNNPAQTSLFNATVTAGSTVQLYLKFNDGMFCVAGNGCQVGGEYT